MKTKNVIQEKCFLFSVKVIQVCKELKINREFELARQLLKSDTSIGANVEEAIGASSRKDCINKLSIAYKELEKLPIG
jgi:four helix bundle protein